MRLEARRSDGARTANVQPGRGIDVSREVRGQVSLGVVVVKLVKELSEG